jgi:hypothetical protein
MDSIIRALKSRMSSTLGKSFSWALVLFMVIWSCLQNYDLVFNQYQQRYLESSWNTSEVGHVIRDFADSVGGPDNAWLVGYPYWMDSRLVGINAGYPTKDYAIFADRFQDTLSIPGTKLFVLNMQDTEGLSKLHALYPNGVLRTYISKVETKDFQLFMVPGEPAPMP